MKYFILFIMIIFEQGLFAQLTESLNIKQLDSLNNVSLELAGKGNLEKAFELNDTIEKIAIEKIGRESLTYANICFNRGKLFQLAKKFNEVEKWFLESKSIKEKVIGKKHPDYILSINNLANFYMANGSYEKAEFYFLEVKEITEVTEGKIQPNYAVILNNLANIYRLRGDNLKAETYFLETLNLRAKVFGKDHADYAKSLNNLANFYVSVGAFLKAEPLYLEVKEIRFKIFGKNHLSYASILHNLGNYYHNLGDFLKAEMFYLESLEIKSKLFGTENIENLITLNNLGVLYFDLGYYNEAEKIYLESKRITVLLVGKETPDYATVLHNLAGLYTAMGDYSKSESLYLEALNIRLKTIGREHPNYTTTLNNLAVLYKIQGDYSKSEEIFKQIIELAEKTIGKENRDYSSYLVNFANLYQIKGDLTNAERFYLEAIKIKQNSLGKEHPENAFPLENLAEIYIELGDSIRAESLLLESKIIRENAFGKEHPQYLSSLYKLAGFYSKINRFQEATNYYQEANHLNVKLIKLSSFVATESQMMAYLNLYKEKQALFQSFALDRDTTTFSADLYNNALFYKGILLRNFKQLSNHFLKADSTTSNIYRNWIDSRNRLYLELTKPIKEQRMVKELETEVDNYEKLLNLDFSFSRQFNQDFVFKDISKQLQSGEAAVEFVSFQYYNPKISDSIFYAALILQSKWNSPKLIPLFEEKSLDSLLNSKSERRADYVNGLYTLGNRGAISVENPKRSLYDIIWKPLESQLTGIKTIYFSPSGMLNRINLDAIPISMTETLADKYHLIPLNSTRQIVHPTEIISKYNTAVLFGGIQYEQNTSIQNNLPALATRTSGILSFQVIDSTLRGSNWNFLPGSEREVNAIENIMKQVEFQVVMHKGYDATEESFKQIGSYNMPSPRILHIATHGYFYPDPKNKQKATGLSDQDESVFKLSNHPMLRSGLIMAGGNGAWQGKKTLEGREDGILTAYEISLMNLSNTELVVLSACETGLGDIQGNEGVYGLQRAFKIAGAKYLIMSLWQVPDKQTSILMTTFYKKWLEDKLNIPDAFHAAQKELRDLGLDPYQWAGFVLVE